MKNQRLTADHTMREESKKKRTAIIDLLTLTSVVFNKIVHYRECIQLTKTTEITEKDGVLGTIDGGWERAG